MYSPFKDWKVRYTLIYITVECHASLRKIFLSDNTVLWKKWTLRRGHSEV